MVAEVEGKMLPLLDRILDSVESLNRAGESERLKDPTELILSQAAVARARDGAEIPMGRMDIITR